MKAIHNDFDSSEIILIVVLYLKDTKEWKQFTTQFINYAKINKLCCISKILKNESNSQHAMVHKPSPLGCVVSQRY